METGEEAFDDPVGDDFEPAEPGDIGGLEEIGTWGAVGWNRAGHSARNVGERRETVNALEPFETPHRIAGRSRGILSSLSAPDRVVVLDGPSHSGVSPMHRSTLRIATLLALVPALASAQSDKQIRAAGALITPKAVFERISVIAHDSMGGRNTPSPGLEKTAQWLADNYKKWGLKPAGENGTYFQRYTMVKRAPDIANSYFEAIEGDHSTTYKFDKWAYPSGPMTGKTISGPIRILAGAITVKDVEPLQLSGQIVLWVQNAARGADNALVGRALRGKGLAALVIMTNQSSAQFALVRRAALQGRAAPEGIAPTGVPTITVHDSLFANDGQAANRPNWSQMREAPQMVNMDPPAGVQFTLVLKDTEVSRFTAPNVVAMVPGSDPVLKNEYVIFSGHMDHVGIAGDGVGGCTAKGADSICNGADDDASGTTGLVSIAQAVAALKVKPKRSIVILNVSGEEKGLLGSAYFAEHPTIPMDKIVADINLDMIGRNATDSIVVIGKEHSDLGVTLAGVQQAHPELKLVAADDIWPEQSFYTRSDHFNFARKGVPVLFFFNGTHPQYHQPDDEVKLIDTSKLARVAQLGFYFAVRIANTVERPKWNPDSYQLIVVEGKTPPAVRKSN